MEENPSGQTVPGSAPHSGNPLAMLEHFFDLYLGRKAPQIPAIWRQRLVTAIPWITLILLILSLPAVLILLGIGTFAIPGAMVFGGIAGGMGYTISVAILAVSLLLELFALPGLFKHSHGGWRLLYYAALLSLISNIIYFSIGEIIGGIIGLWILFQVKSHYN
jgi:hypothetical protein